MRQKVKHSYVDHNDAKMKEVIKRIISSKEEELPNVLGQILSSYEIPKTDVSCWVEVLNHFDEILEKSTNNNIIFSLGDPTPLQKKSDAEKTDKKKKEEKQKIPQPEKETTNVEKLVSICNFTSSILANCKNKSFYNSKEHISELLNSENDTVVFAAVQVLYHYIKRDPLAGKNSTSLEAHEDILRKLMSLASGYGENSIQSLGMKEEIGHDLLRKGSAFHYELYQQTYSREHGKVAGSEKQKAGTFAKVVVDIPNVHEEYENPFQLFTKIMTEYNLLKNKKNDIWTRIRLTYGIKDFSKRKNWTLIRLKSIAVLAYGTQSADFLAKYLSEHTSFVRELETILNSLDDAIPEQKEVIAACYDVFSALTLGKTRIATIIDILLPTGANTVDAILSKLLRTIQGVDYFTISREDEAYLNSAFLLLSSVIGLQQGAKVFADAGLLAQLVNLIQSRSKEWSSILLKSLSLIELLLYTNQSNAILQSGVIKESIKILSAILEKVKIDTDKTIEDVLPRVEYDILVGSFTILRLAVQKRSTEINSREFLESPLLLSVSTILENPKFFGNLIFNAAAQSLSHLLSNQPTSISLVSQSGILSRVIEVIGNHNIAATNISSVSQLFSTLSLNETCFEELNKSNAFLLLSKFLLDPNISSVIDITYVHSLSRDIFDYIQSRPSVRETVMDGMISLLSDISNSLNEKISKPDQTNKNDLKKFIKSVTYCSILLGRVVGANSENCKYFVEKGGLDLFIELITKQISKYSTFDLVSIQLIGQIATHQPDLLLKTLTSIIKSKISDFPSVLDIEDQNCMNKVYAVSSILGIVFELFSAPNNSQQFPEWAANNSKDILLPLVNIEVTVRKRFVKLMLEVEKLNQDLTSDDEKKPETESQASSSNEEKVDKKALEAKKKAIAPSFKLLSKFCSNMTSLYETLQRIIFFAIVPIEGVSTTPVSTAVSIANYVILAFVNLFYALKEATDLSVEEKFLFAEDIYSEFYKTLVSDRHRNMNTFLLKECLNEHLIDLLVWNSIQLMKEYSSWLGAQSKDSNSKTKYESLLVTVFKPFQKLVNPSYITTSPMTASLLTSQKKEDAIDISKVITTLHTKIAKFVLAVWKNDVIMQSSSSIIIVNIVAYLISGVQNVSSNSGRNDRRREVQVDDLALAQLLSMGYSDKAARAALQRCRNNVNLAVEWLLSNPNFGTEEDTDTVMSDDREMQQAIRMSLQAENLIPEIEESIIDNQDYTEEIRNTFPVWLTSIIESVSSTSISAVCDVMNVDNGSGTQTNTVVKYILNFLKTASIESADKLINVLTLVNSISSNQTIPTAVKDSLLKDGDLVSLLLKLLETTLSASKLEKEPSKVVSNILKLFSIYLQPRLVESSAFHGVKETELLSIYEEQVKEVPVQKDQREKLFDLILRMGLKQGINVENFRIMIDVLSQLVSNKSYIDDVNAAEVLKLILPLPSELRYRLYTAGVENLLKLCIERDDAVFQAAVETFIIQKMPDFIIHHGRVEPRFLLDLLKGYAQRNIKVVFNAILNVCQPVRLGETSLILKKGVVPSPVKSTLISQVAQVLLDQFKIEMNKTIEERKSKSTKEESSSKQSKSLFEPFQLLFLLTTIVRNYGAQDILLNSSIEDNEGTDVPFVQYLLSECLPYVSNPTSRASLDSSTFCRQALSRVSIFTLASLVENNAKMIISKIASSISSETISPQFLHAVSDVFSIVLNPAKSKENNEYLSKLILENDILSSLSRCLSKLDMNHPDSSEIATAALKVIDVVTKTSMGFKQIELETEVPSKISIDMVHLISEFTKFDSDSRIFSANSQVNTHHQIEERSFLQNLLRSVESLNEQSGLRRLLESASEGLSMRVAMAQPAQLGRDQNEEGDEMIQEDIDNIEEEENDEEQEPDVEMEEQDADEMQQNEDEEEGGANEAEEEENEEEENENENEEDEEVEVNAEEDDEDEEEEEANFADLLAGYNDNPVQSIFGRRGTDFGVRARLSESPGIDEILRSRRRLPLFEYEAVNIDRRRDSMRRFLQEFDENERIGGRSSAVSIPIPPPVERLLASMIRDQNKSEKKDEQKANTEKESQTKNERTMQEVFLQEIQNVLRRDTPTEQSPSEESPDNSTIQNDTTTTTTSNIAPSTDSTIQETSSTQQQQDVNATSAQLQPQQTFDLGIDPTFLAALPDDLRQEVLSTQLAQLAPNYANITTDSSMISQDFLNALPQEIQNEVLEQERIIRRRYQNTNRSNSSTSAPSTTQPPASASSTSNAQPISPADDPAAFLADLPLELQEDAYLSMDETAIARLPENMRREAERVRRNYFMQQSIGGLFRREGLFRERSRAQQDAIESTSNQRPAKKSKKNINATQEPALSEADLISILRFVYVSSFTGKTHVVKILSTMSLPFKSAEQICNLLLDIIEFHDRLNEVPEKLSDLVRGQEFGVQQVNSFNLFQNDKTVPSNVLKRVLGLLISTMKSNPKFSSLFYQSSNSPLQKLFKYCSHPTFLQDQELLQLLLNLIEGVTLLMLKKQSISQKIEALESSSTKDEKYEKKLEKYLLKKKQFEELLQANFSDQTIKEVVKAILLENIQEGSIKFAITILKNISMLVPELRKPMLRELSEITRAESKYVVESLYNLKKKIQEDPTFKIGLQQGKREQKLCRIIQSYSSVINTEKQRLGTTTSEVDLSTLDPNLLKEYSLDFLWESVQSFTAFVSKDEDTLALSSPQVRRLMPLVEAFFAFHSCFANDNKETDTQIGATFEAATPSSASGPKSKIEQFLDKNRKLLNSLARSNPSVLNNSLSLFIKYPKYVDFDNKASWFRSQLKKEQRNNFGEGTLGVRVRRDQIFMDAYAAISGRTVDELKQKINVRFQGEPGVDAGGLRREFFLCLSREMFNPNYALFIHNADQSTFQPNPSSYINPDHLSYFSFIGKIIAMAIYHEEYLDAYFTRSFYKHLLGIPLSYHDIESIDPSYYESLKWILENDITDVLESTFTAEVEEFGVRKTVELKPGGANIPVTNQNKHEYVKLITELKMSTSIKPQLEAFLKSFYDIIPKKLISIFNEQEIELLISGLPEIDINDLRQNTEYRGYSESSSVIKWFWKVVENMDRNQKANLLQFVTGTSKVPLQGFKSLQGMQGIQRFNISRVPSEGRLPSAHTCFNQLELPEYSTEQELKDKLLTAITEGTEGFGFV